MDTTTDTGAKAMTIATTPATTIGAAFAEIGAHALTHFDYATVRNARQTASVPCPKCSAPAGAACGSKWELHRERAALVAGEAAAVGLAAALRSWMSAPAIADMAPEGDAHAAHAARTAAGVAARQARTKKAAAAS